MSEQQSSTDQPSILYEVDQGLALITLNRPQRRNAFNREMLDRWVVALESAAADEAVKVIVVTGAGEAFCSGGDVGDMGNRPTAQQARDNLRDGVQRIPLLLSRIEKPVIAAVNGSATGAGMDLALMCDIRFASNTARFGETYARVGLVPGAGGAYFLPRLVGAAKALELFWSAELIDADEALRIGVVNRVVESEQLMTVTREFALRVAAAPPLSVRLIKQAVYQSAVADLPTSLNLAASLMGVVRGSDDHIEAVAALREKRKGVFHGR